VVEGLLWRLFQCAAPVLPQVPLLRWVSRENEDLDRKGRPVAAVWRREALPNALQVLMHDHDHHLVERIFHLQRISWTRHHRHYLGSIEL